MYAILISGPSRSFKFAEMKPKYGLYCEHMTGVNEERTYNEMKCTKSAGNRSLKGEAVKMRSVS